MKIVICEDEKIFSNQLAGYIKEWEKERGIPTEVFPYINAEKFWQYWLDSEDYDLIFLDIQMGNMDGMELARRIRSTNADIPIVFVTSYKEYAIEAYNVSAMWYLLKPITKEKCFACLDRANQTDRLRKYYVFSDVEKTERLLHADILYVGMYSHTATMVTAAKKYTFRKTISQILEELDDKLFVRCHKSYIVNIRHVVSVSKSEAEMSNGHTVPLSKDMRREVNDMFVRYNLNKI